MTALECPAIGTQVEAHTVAGEGVPVCRVVARHNSPLEDVIQQFIEIPGVARAETEVVLSERVGYRVLPLVSQTGGRTPPQEWFPAASEAVMESLRSAARAVVRPRPPGQ